MLLYSGTKNVTESCSTVEVEAHILSYCRADGISANPMWYHSLLPPHRHQYHFFLSHQVYSHTSL